MLERSLAVVLLALLPMALGQFPLTDEQVWRSCSGVLFVTAPAMFWSQRRRLRRLTNYAPGTLWLLSGRTNVAIQLGVLGAGFVGYVPLPAAFGVALLIELIIAGGQFLRVIASVTSGRG
jgi:uncharacterized protein (DUF2062 family)